MNAASAQTDTTGKESSVAVVQPSFKLDLRLLFLLLLVFAWVIYRPDRARPVDVVDFGEFVPVIRQSEAWFEQLTSMIKAGVELHGRPYVVGNLETVIKWQLFGSWTPGWQLRNALYMIVIIVQCFHLLRRIGASNTGAALGASIFLVAPAAAHTAMRLTVMELLPMIVVLAMALRATSYQRRGRWKTDVGWFMAGSVFVILGKEMMAPVLLFPVMIALIVQPDGSIGRPAWTKPNVALVIAVGLSSILTLVPLAAISLNASTEAVASQYGRAATPVSVILSRWAFTYLPFEPATAALSPMWLAAVFGLLGLLLLGWGMALKQQPAAARILLAIAIVFPLLGVLSYAPWPAFEQRYVFPYLLGSSLLIAIAATHVAASARRGAAMVVFVFLPALALGAADAFGRTSRNEALVRTFDGLVASIADLPGADSVLVASDYTWVPSWTGLGPTLYRLANATDRTWPPMREIRCHEIAEAHKTRGNAIIVFANHCQLPVQPTQVISTDFVGMDWNAWRLIRGSVPAYVLVTHESR